MSSAIFWSRPAVTGGGPTPRGGHSASVVGNLLVVFGGTFSGEGGAFTYCGDTWALDTDAAPMAWTRPALAGGARARAPAARYGHAAAAVGATVYVFGGRGERGAVFNDLWALDCEKWEWRQLPSSTAPPSPRFAASLAAVGGRLVAFGGWDGAVPSAELWVYEPGAGAWSRPRVSGAPPRARHGHAAALDARAGRLLVWGGAGAAADGVPEYLRDTVELDLVSMAWARPRVTGDYPAARAGGASASIANVLVLFGGWAGPAPPPTPPGGARIALPHRAGLGFGATAPPGATVDVPYGPHATTSLLDLDAGEWVTPHVAGDPPGYRYGAAAVARGLRLFIFGGWEDSRPINQLLVLDLSALAGE